MLAQMLRHEKGKSEKEDTKNCDNPHTHPHTNSHDNIKPGAHVAICMHVHTHTHTGLLHRTQNADSRRAMRLRRRSGRGVSILEVNPKPYRRTATLKG